jgi:hypothetical protein
LTRSPSPASSAAPFDTIGAQPDLTVPALDQLPAALAA